MSRQSTRGLAAREVPPGVVETEALANGWFMVAIGREHRTKRFNVTRAEAVELVRVLRANVLTLDGAELWAAAVPRAITAGLTCGSVRP
jgi:hypothetical protein